MSNSSSSESDSLSKGLSSVINLVKENPDLIASVLGMLSSGGNSGKSDISSSTTNESSAEKENPDVDLSKIISSFAPILNSNTQITGKAKQESNMSSLLIALKPYLNSDRQEMVDTLLKVSKIGTLMKNVK